MTSRSSYKGKYELSRPEKYRGNPDNIWFRSLWERQTMKWCELSSNVAWFSSEEIQIPYFCPTDNKMHRYFPDLVISFSSGKTAIIEIKPSHQCKPPKKKQGKKLSTLTEEVLTWEKNKAKWNAADEYAKKNGMVFQVWDENVLKNLGIKIIKDARR